MSWNRRWSTAVGGLTAVVLLLALRVEATPGVVTLDMRARNGLMRRRSSDNVPVTGCPSRDFSVQVTIGTGTAAQTFDLIVDSGSSTLAVAGDSCNCGGVTPVYASSTHQNNGATNTHEPLTGSYGDKSSWNGTIWIDQVSIGTISLSNMNIAVQTSESSFYSANCNNVPPAANQGIIGMAYEILAAPSNDGSIQTDSFPDRWEQIHLGTGQGLGINLPGSFQFATLFCESTGTLMLNGYDPSLAISSPYYVPITPNSYYVIQLNGLSFTGSDGTTIQQTVVPVSQGANVFGTTIVDTGTTGFVVPSTVAAAMNNYMNNNNYFVNMFNRDFLIGNLCLTGVPSNTLYDINQNLPWLRLDLQDNFSVALPPLSSYLMVSNQGASTSVICSGLLPIDEVGTSETILGWSILNNFLVIFDRTNTHFPTGAIGFAATNTCGTGYVAKLLLNNTVFAGNQSFPTTTPTPTTNGASTLTGTLLLSMQMAIPAIVVAMITLF